MKRKDLFTRVPEGGAIDDEGSMTAERYSEIMGKRLAGEYKRFADRVLALPSFGAGSRLLEIGPGPGWISVIIARGLPDVRIDAVEASADMIRVFSANCREAGILDRVTPRQGVVEEIGRAADGLYDIVYSRDSLHHWTDPAAAFRGIRGILKPGGRLIIVDSRRDMGFGARLLVNLISPTMPDGMGKYWVSSVQASYTREEAEGFVRPAGFSAWKVEADFMNLVITAEG